MQVKNGVLIDIDDTDINKDGTFTFPKNVNAISENAFAHCDRLLSIIIPKTITYIDEWAFAYCKYLKEVRILSDITYIANECFLNCDSLETVILPPTTKEIGNSCFERCISLEEISIPECVTKINDSAFCDCENLKVVKLNKNIESIGLYAFRNCTSLENIEFSQNLKIIDSYAFLNCKSLEEIVIPESIQYIGEDAFFQSGISELSINNNKCEFDGSCFSSCHNLKSIKIPSKISFYKDEFYDCPNLKEITIDSQKIKIKEIVEKFYGNSIGEIIIALSSYNFNSAIKWPSHFLANLSNEERNKVLSPKSIKFFKEIYESYKDEFEKLSLENINNLYLFAYYIGCFDNETSIINRRETNVAQKSCDFLKRILDKKIINFNEFDYYFEDLEIKKYNPNFINFITQKKVIDGEEIYDNFEYLLSKGRYVSTILNSFDKIDKQKIIVNGLGKTNNHPTTKNKIESFIYYPSFRSMEEEDKELAETLSSQMNIREYQFLEAKKILKEAKKAPHHILKEELKEDINELKQKIINETKCSKTHLDLIFDKEFSYEWLDKHDIDNLMLGVYCDCCASITSTIQYGLNIMKSAMILDNEQNLVIRNYNNEIIAKATIYVNKKYGYAVFNDIELNTKYGNERFEDAVDHFEIREKIYATFKRGVNDFVKKYNEQNKIPITQVNVGWENNRLKQTLKKLEKESDVLLETPDYFKDAKNKQWIIYKKKEKKSV